MVNSRESLAKIPSMNNDANPYIIILDIYKEGYWAYDISNYYKGRVDDNGTPFMVRWFEHGQLKNVQGLRPFIRGTVGQHTIDDQTNPDNPKVVPSPDCSQIDQTGETTDTAPGGIAIYRMVNQCFTQEGMFYGEIGLKDSSGIVLSSVDIAFKVLGGRMNMIGARKFYVSEFEKALADFEDQIKKLHDDFNAQTQTALHELEVNYNNIAKNAHDSATAAQREIDAVRANNQKLAGSIGDLQAQVDAGGLETIINHNKDVEELRTRIDNRLKRISNQVPAFQSLDALRNKYPLGTDGLFRVGDQGYMWQNNEWENIGELPSAAVSDADYTERLGYFLAFGNNMMPSITETRKWLDESKQNAWSGSLTIPEGQIITLGSEGKFYRFSKEQTVNFSYKQKDIDNNGLLTFYFDGISNIYAAFTPVRRNDVVIFSLYNGIVYGLNANNIVVNNRLNSSFTNPSLKQSIMDFNNQILITSIPSDENGVKTWSGQIKIPKGTLIWDSIYTKQYQAISHDQIINYKYSQNDVSKNGLYTIYYSFKNQELYGGFERNAFLDPSIFSIYSNKVYDSDYRLFVVNGNPYGGHKNKRYQKAINLTLNSVGPITVNTTHDNKKEGQITIPQGTVLFNEKERTIRTVSASILDFSYSQNDVDTHGGMPSLFYDVHNNKFYFDFNVQNDKDWLIFSIYETRIYNTAAKNIIINNIKDGGHGNYIKHDLTDWRILANSGQKANIAWLGDSTFEGFRVVDKANIAASYINRYLSSLYSNVQSYNASKGGWTTRQLADNFDTLTKDIPNLKLVIIGGGLNDGGNIIQSRPALQDIVNKVYAIGATPIITTTQNAAVPFITKEAGGDWNKQNILDESINEMRREFAKENDIALIDLNKLDEKFAEFSSLPLHELFTYSDNFNDYLHGIDKIHQFEAQAVLAYIAGDKIDLINNQKTISVFTMRAKSELSANKYQRELVNASLNAKGFKASWQGTDVKDKKVLDYNFFVPAGENKYYLNVYNLGDPVSVSLNGDITQLTGIEKVATLEPGYYHVIVKPTTANINFVGLRIETDNLAESTVQPTTPQTQPASGTAPANTEPAKQETGETSSKPSETQAQPTEQNKDSDKQ